MITIRPATPSDETSVWEIFHEVVAGSDTYVFDPDISQEAAMAYWFHRGTHTYVAEKEGVIIGTYILKANQPGRGSHVANASFMVSANARGSGAGKAMGIHCLQEAKRLGFRAMQFNIVISTNEGAIRLWKQLGSKIVGTLPGVYRHSTLGFVDAFVMFQDLTA